MDKGHIDQAYRNVGDLIVAIIERSSYKDKNPNEIIKEQANVLLEKARTVLNNITETLQHVCINQCSSMVATISELQIALSMWTMKASVAKALQQSLSKAEVEMTNGNINGVREQLGKFVNQLMTGPVGVTDSDIKKFTIDQSNSLIHGAINILTGNIPWKKFKVSPPFKLCDGSYNYGFSISDIAGNRCREINKTIIVDTTAPKVISVSPKAEEIVAGRNFQLEILASDSTLPQFLLRPSNSLILGNELFQEILVSNCLLTISDVLLLNNNSGALKDSLTELILRAQALEKIIIETEKYSNVLFWKCTTILETSAEELQKLIPVPATEIELLQTTLSNCRDLGLSLFNDLFLYEFAFGKPSEITEFTLLLDGKDITEKSSRENNSIRYVSPNDLLEGYHQLDLKLVDHAGNASTFHSAFYADTTAPVISQVKPIDNLRTNQKGILISAKFSDEKAGVDPKSISLEVDGKDVTGQITLGNNQVSFIVTEPEEGLHTFKIKCADLVGNLTVLDNQSFFIDHTKPTVIIDPLLDESATTNSEVMITGTLSEKATVEVNGKAAKVNDDFSFSVLVDLEPGHNRFIAAAIDVAGNESSSNAVDIYYITKNDCAITGIIRTENDSPVSGVVVTSDDGKASALTNELGRFSISGLPAGNLILKINPVPLETDGYKSFIIEKTASYGSITQLKSIVYLLKTRINEGTAIASDNEITELASLNDDKVSLSIKNDLIEFPSEDSRNIAAYTIDSTKLPVDVPEFFPHSSVVVLEPAGLTVKNGDGIHIKFPNTFSLEKGTIVPLISYDSVNGKWGIGGIGKVSDDAQAISSIPGCGVRHFSYVAPCPPGPQIEPLREDVHVPGADALKGGLETSIELPTFRSLGQDIKPELIYSSLTASPVVQVTGVFKGMKEISEITTEVLPPVDQTLTGQRIEITDNYSQWRSGGKSGV
ncbi:MAG TPA: hypothetical protein VFJ43_08470, partial [Bacteroidia bacterium]|nr:hypothetical protein [Bacteroidia bacterium]